MTCKDYTRFQKFYVQLCYRSYTFFLQINVEKKEKETNDFNSFSGLYCTLNSNQLIFHPNFSVKNNNKHRPPCYFFVNRNSYCTNVSSLLKTVLALKKIVNEEFQIAKKCICFCD